MTVVEVYQRTDRHCANCFAVGVYLTREGVTFAKKELTDDIQAEFKDHGFREQPIVVYNGRAHSGFRLDKLRALVAEWKEENHG